MKETVKLRRGRAEYFRRPQWRRLGGLAVAHRPASRGEREILPGGGGASVVHHPAMVAFDPAEGRLKAPELHRIAEWVPIADLVEPRGQRVGCWRPGKRRARKQNLGVLAQAIERLPPFGGLAHVEHVVEHSGRRTLAELRGTLHHARAVREHFVGE